MMYLLTCLLVFMSCLPAFGQGGPAVGAAKNPGEGGLNNGSFVLMSNSPSFPNGRAITEGANIDVADTGPGGSVTIGITGQIPITNGGTGQGSRQAAINALLDSGALSSQDLIFFDGTNITRLPRGSSGQFLTVNGSNQLAWTAGTGGGISTGAEVILGSIDASATNARILTQGTGIAITNSGTPDGAITVAINSSVATLAGSQTLTNKTLTSPTMGWNSGAGFNLAASAFTSALKWADWAAARNLTIPDPGADASFVMTEGNATVNGTKTFSDLKLSGTTFKTASNTITVPAATDTLVNLGSTQTLTNKTISAGTYDTNMKLVAGGNTYTVTWAAPGGARAYTIPNAGSDAYFALTGTGITHAAGAAIYSNGSTMMCSAAGSSGQPLLSNGSSAPAFGNLAAANGGTGQTSYTKGDLLVTPGSTTLSKLAVGTDGYVLTADAASTNGVKWAAVSPSLTLSGLNHLSYSAGTLSASGSTGDTPYFSGTNTISKRSIGSTGQVYTVVSGVPNWSSTPAVKWNILTKSAGFTANDQSQTYYLITASSALTVTLPASPADGSIYKFCRVSGSGLITFTPNGAETVRTGDTTDTTFILDGGSVELVAVSGGWIVS